MPLALIQLISEQTMQNLVPLLALKPAKVFHLATPKTAARSASITAAAQQAQILAELENLQLSEMPSIPETSRAVRRAVAEAKASGLIPVVNFTGGTKLMSIGAYEAAMREQAVSLYVDTNHQQFVDGHTGPKLNTVLGDDFSFTPLQTALNVDAIALANGRHRVTSGLDWRPFLTLAQHLFNQPQDEAAVWEALHGRDGLCPNGREPRDAGAWLRLLDQPFNLPKSAGQLAVEAGLLRSKGEAFCLPDAARHQLTALNANAHSAARDYFETVRPLQFALAFLSGAWWEVVVADAAHRSGQFRDLRWSVNVSEHQPGSSREEDIVGVDGVQIVYFSCKRGGAKARLIPHLDEVEGCARNLGGQFTRRFLAVYQPPQGAHAASLRKRATELNGIQILTPHDLKDLNVFARRPR